MLDKKDLRYIKLMLIAKGTSRSREIANKIKLAKKKHTPVKPVKKKKPYKKPRERYPDGSLIYKTKPDYPVTEQQHEREIQA